MIAGNTLKIIEENDKMITIAVSDLYTKEELEILDNLNLNEIFGAEDPFLCQACPLTFDCQHKLDMHTRLHERNMHFCKIGCGRCFPFLNKCLDHEYRDHATDLKYKFACRICQSEQLSIIAVSQHMRTNHFSIRKHICSLCRNEFQTNIELINHWKDNPKKCGLIKFDLSWILCSGESIFVGFNQTSEKVNSIQIILDSENDYLSSIQPNQRVLSYKEKVMKENINKSNESMVQVKRKSKPLDNHSEVNLNCSSLSSELHEKEFTSHDINKATTTNEASQKFDRNAIQINNTNMTNLRVLKESPTVNGSSITAVNNWDINKMNVNVENRNNNSNASFVQLKSGIKILAINNIPKSLLAKNNHLQINL